VFSNVIDSYHLVDERYIKVVGTSFTEMFAANDWKPNIGEHTLPFKNGHGLPILKWYGMSSCDL
jgi:hypothetical protein